MRVIALLVCSLIVVPSVAAASNAPTAPATSARYTREPTPGVFTWPLDPRPTVARPFQAPPSAWGAGHRGTDLLGTVGQPVFAAGDGKVTFAGRIAGRGVVAITHAGGLRTTYEPVAATIDGGQAVRRGDPIGHLEAGHASCDSSRDHACLHWGARREDYLNPFVLLGTWRVRLLPWRPLAPSS